MVATGQAARRSLWSKRITQSKPCKGGIDSARPYRTPTNFRSVPVAALLFAPLTSLATGYHLSPLARLVESFPFIISE